MNIPLPELKWIDRSRPPCVGMWVEAYFKGKIEVTRVVEWEGNRCWFSNSLSLRWSNVTGFGYDHF